MKRYRSIIAKMLLGSVIFFYACNGDDNEDSVSPEIEISVEDFSTTTEENPLNNAVLGTVTASTNTGDITFSLTSENPDAAIDIDPTTGALSVADSALFDFEVNPTITATFSATVGERSETASITISLENIADIVAADPFAVTIDENPLANQVLGTVMASADGGASLSYSLMAGDNATAFAIDATSGELSVADAAQFDFEVNPVLTATYEADNGQVSEQGIITVTLNDVAEGPGSIPLIVDVQDFGNNRERLLRPVEVAGFTNNYTVDWGDGTIDRNLSAGKSHTYTAAGIYEVKVSGTLSGIRLDALLGAKELKQWGNIEWQTFRLFLNGSIDFEMTATDVPDLRQVTDMSAFMTDTDGFVGDFTGWDFSNVENMSDAFSFSFNTSGINISNLDVSNVTNMKDIFSNSDFNQDISSWDVSSVTNLENSFRNSSFNQVIGNWDVSNVTNFRDAFNNASSFDQSLENWDISNATTMQRMLDNSGLSRNNYEDTLVGWESQANVPSSIPLGALNLEYARGDAINARDRLINTNGWFIAGDILINE